MQKLFIIIIIAFGCYCFYAEYKSGYCGFGMFNKLPNGLNVDYINGYDIYDSDGWGVIYTHYEGFDEKNDKFIINEVIKISYEENEFYALIETKENHNLYAIINHPKPINNEVQFVTAEEFITLNSSKLNWIEINSSYCKAGSFMGYAIYYFYALIAIFTIIFSIAWIAKYDDR